LLREKSSKVKIQDSIETEKLIQELIEKFDPFVVILHGSAAKGKFVDNLSDIDIIVISSKFTDVNPKDRFIQLLEAAQRHALKIEALGYTLDEFTEMIRTLNFFALDITYYGIPLFNKDNTWETILENFDEVKKKHNLRKTPSDGWIFSELPTH